MTTPRRSLTTLVAVVILGLAGAGCGVKTADDVATGDTSATTAAPATTAPDDEPTDTTEADEPIEDDPTETTEADEPTETTEADEPTDTTEADTPDTPSDIDEQVITAMVDQFTAMGLDEEQSTCLAEKLYADFGNGEDPSTADPSAYFEYFDACGISISDLGGLSEN